MKLAILVLAAGLATAPHAVLAQAPKPKAAPSAPAAPALEPAAVEALKRLGEHLLTLQSFEITSVIAFDYVLDNNQKIQIGGTVRHRVRRPDRLRIDLATDVLDRVFQYDGKTLTVIAPKESYYAQVDAKPTIKETLAWAAQNFGVEMPLADLFDWGTPDAPHSRVREGFRVGKASIGGVECDHWAFRGPGHDWEIWIRTGDAPLPLKLSIVNTSDPARPRYEAILTWTEKADVADDVFVHAPAADAKRIEFQPVAPTRGPAAPAPKGPATKGTPK
ncbi:DUF2092 domain-containing protein [Vineibacter terrae]|uniref:DUF2092 domain-containing protein n=1 Tax=Vineibacter terrae TaxID=2586908 RepID=UPI002E2FE137|nr:DUF2092 domain-containing protein [Vineibacter terrae]HEX2885464.1 DUF2092 domain-containing protein [Vineibacter terrae]